MLWGACHFLRFYVHLLVRLSGCLHPSFSFLWVLVFSWFGVITFLCRILKFKAGVKIHIFNLLAFYPRIRFQLPLSTAPKAKFFHAKRVKRTWLHQYQERISLTLSVRVIRCRNHSLYIQSYCDVKSEQKSQPFERNRMRRTLFPTV